MPEATPHLTHDPQHSLAPKPTLFPLAGSQSVLRGVPAGVLKRGVGLLVGKHWGNIGLNSELDIEIPQF